ncbi:hypothetical protein HK102_002107 [Quaeritorhiza haematococci]|nr:hypothetical protein HK102_002107 [Quaeritorhiza haematococci]
MHLVGLGPSSSSASSIPSQKRAVALGRRSKPASASASKGKKRTTTNNKKKPVATSNGTANGSSKGKSVRRQITPPSSDETDSDARDRQRLGKRQVREGDNDAEEKGSDDGGIEENGKEEAVKDEEIASSSSGRRTLRPRRAPAAAAEKKEAQPPAAKKPKKPPPPSYTAPPDELEESERFEVIGEDEYDVEGELPCRNIDQYAFYDVKRNNRLVSIEELNEDGREIACSGIVTRQVENEEEEEEDDEEEEEEEEEEEDENENGERIVKKKEKEVQRMKTSAIFTCEDEYLESGYPTIWIRTQYAFYRLLTPRQDYLPFIRPYLTKQRLMGTVIAMLMQDKFVSYDHFIEHMNDVNFAEAMASSSSGAAGCSSSTNAFANRTSVTAYPFLLTEQDVRNYALDVHYGVSDWFAEQNTVYYVDAPILDKFTEIINKKGGFKKKKGGSQISVFRKKVPVAKISKIKNTNTSVLQKRNPSTVTPLVAEISRGLLGKHVIRIERGSHSSVDDSDENDTSAENAEQEQEQQQQGEGSSEGLMDVSDGESDIPSKGKRGVASKPLLAPPSLQPISKLNTKTVKFVGVASATVRTRTYYDAVNIDGEVFRVNDCVYVRNDDSKEPWFARLCYLYSDFDDEERNERSRVKMAHVRWFLHGKDTFLCETAGYNELFLVDSCDHIDLHSVAGRCEVRYWDPGMPEPKFGSGGLGENVFFYRYWYEELTATMEEATVHDKPPPALGNIDSDDELVSYSPRDPFEAATKKVQCAEHEWCPSCEAKISAKEAAAPKWIKGRPKLTQQSQNRKIKGVAIKASQKQSVIGLRYKNTHYRLNDFVYIIPEVKGAPYDIAQIVGFGTDGELSDRVESEPEGLNLLKKRRVGFANVEDSKKKNSKGKKNGDINKMIRAMEQKSTKKYGRRKAARAIDEEDEEDEEGYKDGSDMENGNDDMDEDFDGDVRDNEGDDAYVISDEFEDEYDDGKGRKSSDVTLFVKVRLFQRYNDVLLEKDRLRRKGGSSKGSNHPLIDSVPSATPRDERRLYLTNDSLIVDAEHLEGVCWVQHRDCIQDLDAYRVRDDSFWYEEIITKKNKAASGKTEERYEIEPCTKDDITFCVETWEEKRKRERELARFLGIDDAQEEEPVEDGSMHDDSQDLASKLKDLGPGMGMLTGGGNIKTALVSNEADDALPTSGMFDEEIELEPTKKLVAMDIFSGCGGLSVGMEATGVVETRHAIEFTPSAAKTFKENFPHATVYNQCANMLLERAIRKHEHGEQLEPATDFMGRPLVDLPPKGSVDFIYCGPPCQGFSGINRFKKADDIKNTLVATSLSYADFYRPKYFLLENVRGLVSCKLGGKQVGTNKIEGGITNGVLKFICRSLIAMDYQVKFCLQQAGHQGLPQSRRRLFVWGVKRPCSLVDFPQPTHCFGKQGSLTIQLPNKKTNNPIKRSNGSAPYPPITVWDAISDLPAFEYVNPHQTYPPTPDSPQKKFPTGWNDGINDEIVRLPVPTNTGGNRPGAKTWVGEMRQEYQSEPLSEFQRLRRVGSDNLLVNHVTKAFNTITVERIVNVEMEPGADHRSLPEKLKPWCLSHPNSAAGRHGGWKGLFGRLDYTGHFLTALTDVAPMGKQGTVIHPTQRRVLSVRECARAQGFPDSFEFFSCYENAPDAINIKEHHRLVGNAVPPPLAFALGKKLVEAMMRDSKIEKARLKDGKGGKGKGKAAATAPQRVRNTSNGIVFREG